MKKGIYLFSLVAFLMLSGLIETVSGFVLWLVLPSGGGKRAVEVSYLGFTRHTWIDIHDWVAIALTAVVVIHLMVHWKWILRMIKQLFIHFTETYREMSKISSIKSS
jgi:hypothetical protein